MSERSRGRAEAMVQPRTALFDAVLAEDALLAPLVVKTGTAGNDSLDGTSGADTLSGVGGNDRLRGLAGADSLDGGDGDDTLVGGDQGDVLVGGAGADLLQGGNGNDTLEGGLGNDTLQGGAGTDTARYVGVARHFNIGVTASGYLQLTDYQPRNGNEGQDRLLDVERLVFSLGEEITVTAGTNGYRLDGSTQDDWISVKGPGAITVFGGAGDDTYDVDSVADVIVENADEGIDTIRTLNTLTLPDHVENLVLLQNDSIDGTGNALANAMTGNGANNVLSGGDGNDTLVGGDGDDRLIGAKDDDHILGGAGNDTLSAGGGADVLEGGAGDDFYSLVWIDDVVTELEGEGTDKVYAYNNRTLDANVEIMYLWAKASVGAGNELANKLYANDSIGSLMDGDVGNDEVFGGRAADTLLGGDGDDTLRGTDTVTGGYDDPTDGLVDLMQGGDGNDVYYVYEDTDLVDEPDSSTDRAPAGGKPGPVAGGTNIDTVISQVSYTLRANIENLELAGSDNLTGTGNELDNLITGNGGNNLLSGLDGVDVIDGGGGNDTLVGGIGRDTLGGGAGDDLYRVGSGDVLIEAAGEGLDTVESSVPWTLAKNLERLVLGGSGGIAGTGNTGNNALTGNGGGNLLSGAGGNDTLSGLGGADTLVGGAGKDTLSGGAGADRFRFDAPLSASTNVDTLTDFTPGSDLVQLSRSVFGDLATATGATLQAGEFIAAATAADAGDRILYDLATGTLYYDPDGTGAQAAVRFAVLETRPVLDASHFSVIA